MDPLEALVHRAVAIRDVARSETRVPTAGKVAWLCALHNMTVADSDIGMVIKSSCQFSHEHSTWTCAMTTTYDIGSFARLKYVQLDVGFKSSAKARLCVAVSGPGDGQISVSWTDWPQVFTWGAENAPPSGVSALGRDVWDRISKVVQTLV